MQQQNFSLLYPIPIPIPHMLTVYLSGSHADSFIRTHPTHSTHTAHQRALILHIRRRAHSRLACRLRSGPKGTNRRQDRAAAIEIDGGGAVSGTHGPAAHQVEIADDGGEIAHEDFARIGAGGGETGYFHEGCELDGFVCGLEMDRSVCSGRTERVAELESLEKLGTKYLD